jgi:hypothetical protein
MQRDHRGFRSRLAQSEVRRGEQDHAECRWNTNVARQPKCVTTKPPATGANTGPSATIIISKENARAASCGWQRSRTIARPITNPAEPPSA